MARGGAKKTALSPQQHQRVREQLGAVMRLIQAGELEQAKASLGPILRRHPAVAEVCHVAAGLHGRLNERERAIYYAEQAVRHGGGQAEYLAGLGTLLVQDDQHEAALGPLREALSARPELTQALVGLGTALMQTGELGEARAVFGRVLEREAGHIEAVNNLALIESDTGNAHAAVEIIERGLAAIGDDDPKLLDGLCMFASYDDRLTPAEVFAIHRRFGEAVQRRVRTPAGYPNEPEPGRRVRVGFVSPDLRAHSVAYFLGPIVEHLDRERFEVCVYFTSGGGDAVTDRLRGHADLWRDCTAGIAATHKRIVDDRVDVLVELTGHFAGNQLPLFAARPSPVSVTMIGYGNTTGLASIDARLIDGITDPAGAEGLASESLVRLDGCFLCYRPPDDAPEPGDPGAGDSDGGRPFTFGSFNDLRKMSPSTLELWGRILVENPGTRLVLKTSRLGQEQVRVLMRERLASLGVDPERVELLGRTAGLREHLELYNTVDCGLDTFPYTGTTTTCEAALMGVPTVTLLGDAHAGRVSASLLRAMGRGDLVAETVEDYARLARELAVHGKRSKAERLGLRRALLESAVCDGPAYAAGVGNALSGLWRGWCEKKGGS